MISTVDNQGMPVSGVDRLKKDGRVRCDIAHMDGSTAITCEHIPLREDILTAVLGDNDIERTIVGCSDGLDTYDV